jgi:hypothetical protein
MTQGNVCEIEQWRPIRRTRVHDLEHGLQVPIQIHDRTRAALKGQWLIALIPPSVWYPTREPHGSAGPRVKPLTIDLHR